MRCDARGVPIREEIIMAAEESAQFHRWSATTNVTEEVLAQRTDLASPTLTALRDDLAGFITRPPPALEPDIPT